VQDGPSRDRLDQAGADPTDLMVEASSVNLGILSERILDRDCSGQFNDTFIIVLPRTLQELVIGKECLNRAPDGTQLLRDIGGDNSLIP
jgi:hypothetical protein